METVGETEHDVAGLHAKLDRTATVEKTNTAATSDFKGASRRKSNERTENDVLLPLGS